MELFKIRIQIISLYSVVGSLDLETHKRDYNSTYDIHYKVILGNTIILNTSRDLSHKTIEVINYNINVIGSIFILIDQSLD